MQLGTRGANFPCTACRGLEETHRKVRWNRRNPLVDSTHVHPRDSRSPPRIRRDSGPGLRSTAAGPARPTGEADLQPVPPQRRPQRRPGRARPLRLPRGIRHRRGGTDRSRRRPDDVRGARGRPAAKRIRPARRSAAAHDHHRRCRDGPGHRGLLLPQRPAARVGPGAAHPHRWRERPRRGGHRHRGQRARRALPHLPELLWLARLRPRPRHRARAGLPLCRSAARPF